MELPVDNSFEPTLEFFLFSSSTRYPFPNDTERSSSIDSNVIGSGTSKRGSKHKDPAHYYIQLIYKRIIVIRLMSLDVCHCVSYAHRFT